MIVSVENDVTLKIILNAANVFLNWCVRLKSMPLSLLLTYDIIIVIF